MQSLALILAGVACFAVHFWCEGHCTRLDVETGRRDPGALITDYGSNRGWYPRWKIPSLLSVVAGIALWLCAVVACTIPAQARDLDGRYANSPLKQWFDSLRSGKGPCCSDADGCALTSVEWESSPNRGSCSGGSGNFSAPLAVSSGDGETIVGVARRGKQWSCRSSGVKTTSGS